MGIFLSMTRVLVALAFVALVSAAPLAHKHKKHSHKATHKASGKVSPKAAPVDLEQVKEVKHDIHKLAKAIKGTNMPLELKQGELSKLKQMEEEVASIGSGKKVKSTKDHLRKDMSEVAASLNKFRRAEKVISDLEELEGKVKKSSFAKAAKKEIKKNINSIKDDTHQLEEATGEREEHLKKAIKLRSEALHKQLEEADPVHQKEVARKHEAAKKVKADIRAMEEAVEAADFSPEAVEEIEDNINHIQADVTKFENAESSEYERYRKAISLRVKALHLQLEEQRQLAAVPKVENDVKNLEENLKNSKYSSEDKTAMLDNLEHIAEDARKIAHAKGKKAVAMKEAINKRMTAFKQQLEEAEANISEDADEGDDKAADDNDEAADDNDEAADDNDEAADDNDEAADDNDKAADDNDKAADDNDDAADDDDDAADDNENAADDNEPEQLEEDSDSDKNVEPEPELEEEEDSD